MNIRELKRRLQPYSGYMKPVENGGADSGGEVIDLVPGAGAADGDGGGDDRGDDFTPTPDADGAGDGNDGGEGGGGEKPPVASGADPEGGDGHDGGAGSKGIPKGRFNEVNARRKEAEAALAAANEELAQYRAREAAAKAAEAKPSAPAAAPASQDQAAEPFNFKAQEKAYATALIEGDIDKATEIREAINAKIEEQATARATVELTSRQTAQLLSNTAQSVAKAYPYLNTAEGAEALELILASRDAKMAKGMPAHLALLEAANTIAPRFAPEESETPSRDSTSAPSAKDSRPAAALARGAADSTAQPPALQVGIGQRTTVARVNVAQLTEEQFEALTPAEKSRLRGD
ncbi:hypothetical protein LJR074_002180 [Acidovorax sp. LjRoot74]|uniref:hypothetical protein n=1 Tax=Acidovorax sp. LjRoot74 TaxID=3342337 RepID=UPI003ECC376C